MAKARDAANRLHGGDDPAIERHAGELFGTPLAADPTPPDARYVEAGRVQLQWIGERGPMAVEKIRLAIQIGLLPKLAETILDEMQANATTALPGLAHHTMTVSRDGMSEDYTWGPWEFVVAVKVKDADKILSGSFGHQFRVLNYDGWQPADREPLERFMAALKALQDQHPGKRIITDDAIRKVEAVDVTERQPERLVGVGPGGRHGLWNGSR